MTAATATRQHAISIERADKSAPILYTAGREWIGIYAGTTIRIGERVHAFEADTSLAVTGMLVPGCDYGFGINDDGRPFVVATGPGNPLAAGYIAGFHFAPGGHPGGTKGGDTTPTIIPHSIWDADWLPACRDPRGMGLAWMPDGRAVWVDAYLLGVDHLQHGTSRCGAEIADGRNLPERIDGKGKYAKLDYATAVEIYAHHGKRLLTAEEFFVAAYGVEERCSRDEEPEVTGAMVDGAERFISGHNLFDMTGTMWQWGTDGHPDIPRPSLFGGSFFFGSDAGSQYANLGSWPGFSSVDISARGACDHLSPA